MNNQAKENSVIIKQLENIIEQLKSDEHYYRTMLTKPVFLSPTKRLWLCRLAERLELATFDDSSNLAFEHEYEIPKVARIDTKGKIVAYWNNEDKTYCHASQYKGKTEALIDFVDRQLIELDFN